MNIEELVTPVRFIFDPSKIAMLKERARELDDLETGAHLAEYSLIQAFTIVFQSDVSFLWDNEILDGWVTEPDTYIWENVSWIPEGTPEGYIIEESL